MSVKFPACTYQKYVDHLEVTNQKKEGLRNQLTTLGNYGLRDPLQTIIAGYLLEIPCMSCRQVKQEGAPAIQMALTFFQETLLRENLRFPGRLVHIISYLNPEYPYRLHFGHFRVDEPSQRFDLLITNSWRYSIFNLFLKTYDAINAAMPKTPLAYEERVCFHELIATCRGQSTFSLPLPDVAEDDRDPLEEVMRKERDAITKELVEAHKKNRS